MTALFVGVDVAKSTLEACKFVAGRFHHLKSRNLPYGFQALVDWMGLHFEPQDIFLVVVLMLVNLSDAQVALKRFDTLIAGIRTDGIIARTIIRRAMTDEDWRKSVAEELVPSKTLFFPSPLKFFRNTYC